MMWRRSLLAIAFISLADGGLTSALLAETGNGGLLNSDGGISTLLLYNSLRYQVYGCVKFFSEATGTAAGGATTGTGAARTGHGSGLSSLILGE